MEWKWGQPCTSCISRIYSAATEVEVSAARFRGPHGNLAILPADIDGVGQEIREDLKTPVVVNARRERGALQATSRRLSRGQRQARLSGLPAHSRPGSWFGRQGGDHRAEQRIHFLRRSKYRRHVRFQYDSDGTRLDQTRKPVRPRFPVVEAVLAPQPVSGGSSSLTG
jgi:hypothetical protein